MTCICSYLEVNVQRLYFAKLSYTVVFLSFSCSFPRYSRISDTRHEIANPWGALSVGPRECTSEAILGEWHQVNITNMMISDFVEQTNYISVWIVASSFRDRLLSTEIRERNMDECNAWVRLKNTCVIYVSK